MAKALLLPSTRTPASRQREAGVHARAALHRRRLALIQGVNDIESPWLMMQMQENGILVCQSAITSDSTAAANDGMATQPEQKWHRAQLHGSSVNTLDM